MIEENNMKSSFLIILISFVLSYKGMITPLTDNLPVHTILGVLLSLRSIVPHLDNEEQIKLGIKGSFGTKKSTISPKHGKETVLEKKQYLQV